MEYIEKKRANNIANKIKTLKEKCSRKNLYEALLCLSRVSIVVMENTNLMNRGKFKLILTCLRHVEKMLDIAHLFEIKYECERISDIVFNKNQNLTKEEEKIMKNEKKITQLQDIISGIDKQIKSNNEAMEKCLDKDPVSWHQYNGLNKILKLKRMLYLKQYKNCITLAQNMEIVNDAKTIHSNYSKDILKDLANVNTDGFIANIDLINDINNDVKEQNYIIGNKFQNSIDDDIDEEYRTALEEKLSSDSSILQSDNKIKV